MKATHIAPLALAALAGAVVAGPALSAPGPSLPIVGSPNSIVAGVFLPNDSAARRAGGSSQVDVSFRYGLPVPNLIAPTRTVLGLGVQIGARGGGHSTIIPLTVSQVFSTNGASPFSTGTVYVGAGLGLYVLNQSGIKTTARIGGQGLVGYNVTDAVFLEGKYQFVQDGNGGTLAAGLRF